jgi:hypothetical protein
VDVEVLAGVLGAVEVGRHAPVEHRLGPVQVRV